MLIKYCSKCKKVKAVDCFWKCLRTKDGLRRWCKICSKAASIWPKEKWRQYYLAHRKQRIAATIRWMKSNAERVKVRQREWHRRNEKNRVAFNRVAQMRKRRMRNAGALPIALLILEKFKYYGNVCIYCGRGGKMTIEHKIPISRGGLNALANLAPACHQCNRIKGCRKIGEYKNLICQGQP